jgi:asparaginyl-tRNA synthetase
MNLCEEFLRFCVSHILETSKTDLEFLQKMYEPELLQRLNFVIGNPFVRISYTEAIQILEQSGQKFEFPVSWGNDLQSEHERYLVEKHFNSPVIVTDYPRGIKAFYMRANDDGKTVRAMDILFPGIGEVVGGSQREERYDKLLERVKEQGIHEENLWWYLELRKFGTAPHSGFGLGFERLMLFVTGMANIRDVILAPRTPKNARF